MPADDLDPDGGWTQLRVEVAADAVELASDALWRAGAAGIEEHDRGLVVELVAGFETAAAAVRAQAQAAAEGLPATEVRAVTDDGLDAWRAWAAPVRAGRFWITPTWVAAPALDAGEVVVAIDPGRTFGSGSHPTTRLVLGLLEGLVDAGSRVLDVGCGSGVLAIGAALLGAAEVVGTDIEPTSPATTQANAERNGVASTVTATADPLAAVVAQHGRFDVVAANLLAPVIAELAADLVAAVRPGGTLVVSGLLADRWEATTALLAPLAVERVVDEDGWVAVVLSRPHDGDR